MLALFAWLERLQELKQVFEHTAFLVILLCFGVLLMLGALLGGGTSGVVTVPPGRSAFDDDVRGRHIPAAAGVIFRERPRILPALPHFLGGGENTNPKRERGTAR